MREPMSYQASAIGTSAPRICVRRVNPGTAGMSAAKVSELTRILTCTDQLSEPLPQPHQHALQATGAASSILPRVRPPSRHPAPDVRVCAGVFSRCVDASSGGIANRVPSVLLSGADCRPQDWDTDAELDSATGNPGRTADPDRSTTGAAWLTRAGVGITGRPAPHG